MVTTWWHHPAGAHHPGGDASEGGSLGIWLFVAGILVVLLMVGWAVFAPERSEPEHEEKRQ